MGFEPMNTGFADQRVSRFAIGAHDSRALPLRVRGVLCENPTVVETWCASKA
jgi:hypothetical protein